MHNHNGQNNPRYKDGRTLIKPCCLDCGKKLKHYLSIRCKECYNEFQRTGRKDRTEYLKQYEYNHKNSIAERKKQYYQENKERIRKTHTEYMHKTRKLNINMRLAENLRRRINSAIRRNYKSAYTIKLIGCSIETLKQHLESQFKPNMSWSNYGKWHVDHIRQCCTFNLSISEDQTSCFHYTNLRPLWAIENLKRPRK